MPTVNVLGKDRTQELPVVQDGYIYPDVDFTELKFTFYSDTGKTTSVDFSADTFTGEVLDKPGGTKLFDLSFNTPANDGVIWPTLTDVQTATITATTMHYFIYVTDAAGLKYPYVSGKLTVKSKFAAGG